MAAPIIHHRTPDFSAAFAEAIEGLKYVFQTEGDVLLFACSGTGVMEAAIANCFCAGDTVIVCRNGKFGDRQKQICRDLRPERRRPRLRVDRGRRPGRRRHGARREPRRARRHRHAVRDLERRAERREGDRRDRARATRDCVLIVDSITGIGAVECKTDEWGLDVVMTGSQKGLMLPPGLAACTVSREGVEGLRALDAAEVLLRLDEVQEERREGHDAVHAGGLARARPERGAQDDPRGGHREHHRAPLALAEATRKGCEALGLKLFAPPEGRGSAVTPVWVPEGVDGKTIVKIMKNKYGVTIAGGQDDYAGRIFRIGHLGYFGEFDIITTLAALEMTLAELGYEFERGAGIKAAEVRLHGRVGTDA